MRRVRRPLIALVVLLVALAVGYAVRASRSDAPARPIRTVSLRALPRQVTVTVHRVEDGGPFPYPEDDGVVFHNYEHLLPAEPDGYYREYTVPTPGASDRGARRVVTGSGGQFYYTPDHYGSFERLRVPR